MNSEGSAFQATYQQLNRSMAAVRTLLPLPLEQINDPDPVAEGTLASRILGAADAQAVVRLAHSLNSQEIKLVFPLLATTENDRKRSVLAERLNLIVRERACPTLYTSGWLIFQKYFPCQPVAHALAVLCKILDIKTHVQAQPVEAGIRAATPRNTGNLLISHVAAPNARHFVKKLIQRLPELGLTLDQVMSQYEIHDDLALGLELTATSFINGDSAIYTDGQQRFAHVLKHVAMDCQAKLIHACLNREDLPQNIYNRYCQEIFRIFGNPAGGHSIWQQLKPRDRDQFHEWVLAATIGSHCRRHPDKARLYLRYIDKVENIVQWDANTLIIHFPGFLIADSRQFPLLAIYYSQSDPDDGHPFELATGDFAPNPANPAIPHRQVEEAIRRSNRQGTIGLPFDHDGIRLTSIFLDLCLKENHRGLFRKLRRNHAEEIR